MSSSALALLLAGFCAATGVLDANDGLGFVMVKKREEIERKGCRGLG